MKTFQRLDKNEESLHLRKASRVKTVDINVISVG